MFNFLTHSNHGFDERQMVTSGCCPVPEHTTKARCCNNDRLQDFLSLHVVVAAVQGTSTRPERIPATLAGLQELNGKILQDLQQQLQTHLTQAQKALRAQVGCHHASLLVDINLSKCCVLAQIACPDPLLPFADM